MLACLGCQLGALRLSGVVSHSFRKPYFNTLCGLKGITEERGSKASKQESVAGKKLLFILYQKKLETPALFAG